MILEHVSRRVLGAIRLIDANTRLPIDRRFDVAGQGTRFIRNRRGHYVLASAPGLEAHTSSFESPPPAVLESVNLTITVADPRGDYLPRQVTIALPRDPDPLHADRDNSLFRLIEVPLFPSPIGQTAPGSAVIRATVVDSGGNGLPGALIRVARADSSPFETRGMSAWEGRIRGEALVPVPGIPITTWGEEPDDDVLVHEVSVIVRVIFDPDFAPKDRDDPAFDPDVDVPDPDLLESEPAGSRAAEFPFDLASGQTLTARLEIPDS